MFTAIRQQAQLVQVSKLTLGTGGLEEDLLSVPVDSSTEAVTFQWTVQEGAVCLCGGEHQSQVVRGSSRGLVGGASGPGGPV